MDKEQALSPGTKLFGNGYTINKFLGQGGFGITYEGFQHGLNRRVAIKEFFVGDYCYRDGQTSVSVTSQNTATIEALKNKFLKEARMIAKLSHPNIIKIIDVFEENNTAYYVMEFISNESLQSYIERKGALPEKQAKKLVLQIADALQHVHNQKILHLDVKPANIMLQSLEKPILIDFGISKHYTEEGIQTTNTGGGYSPGYAPLEQYEKNGVGKFTPATDVYSLGATLFFMITGKRPPEAVQIYEQGLPPLPSTYSKEIRETILATLRVAKAERLPSVEIFVQFLTTGEVQPIPSTNLRHIIETLEIQGEYKEAYIKCIECIDKGIDIEYAKAKCDYLIPLMRKKNKSKSKQIHTWAIIAAIISVLAPIIIYILIALMII